MDELKYFKNEIEKLKKENQILAYHAYHDRLTGLPNRTALDQVFKTQKYKHIAMIDIDNFKMINDVLGHSKGDEALKELAHKLIELSQSEGLFVERHGGEEFIILSDKENINDFIEIMEKFRNEIENTIAKKYIDEIEDERQKNPNKEDEIIEKNLKIIINSNNQRTRLDGLKNIIGCFEKNINKIVATISIGITKTLPELSDTLEAVDAATYVAKGKYIKSLGQYEIGNLGCKNTIAILEDKKIYLYGEEIIKKATM